MSPERRSRLLVVRRSFVAALVVSLSLAALMSRPMSGDDSGRSVTVDHYVRVKSTVPAMAGQTAQIYVRERASAGTVMRGANLADRVVLFIHGAGTPAEVAFDVPYEDYSWMGYLAAAGYDVFAMDTTGYGRSTRPAPMNDPCNLSPAQQATFVPLLLAGAVRRELSPSVDDNRLGLGRHQRGGRLHPRAATGRSGQPGGLVARRTARRRLCGAAPGQGAEAGAARARLQPRHSGGSRRRSCRWTASR